MDTTSLSTQDPRVVAATKTVLAVELLDFGGHITAFLFEKINKRFVNFFKVSKASILGGEASIKDLLSQNPLVLFEADEASVYGRDLPEGVSIVQFAYRAVRAPLKPQTMRDLDLEVAADPSGRIVLKAA